MAKRKSYLVEAGKGIACPRCGRATQIRAHKEITGKHLRQPFYYTRWFYCLHADCVVSLHMAEEFKVWNDNDAARKLRGMDAAAARRLDGVREQLRPRA